MNKAIFTIRKTNMNWFLLPTNRTEMDLVAFHNNNKKSFLLLSECVLVGFFLILQSQFFIRFNLCPSLLVV